MFPYSLCTLQCPNPSDWNLTNAVWSLLVMQRVENAPFTVVVNKVQSCPMKSCCPSYNLAHFFWHWHFSKNVSFNGTYDMTYFFLWNTKDDILKYVLNDLSIKWKSTMGLITDKKENGSAAALMFLSEWGKRLKYPKHSVILQHIFLN